MTAWVEEEKRRTGGCWVGMDDGLRAWASKPWARSGLVWARRNTGAS